MDERFYVKVYCSMGVDDCGGSRPNASFEAVARASCIHDGPAAGAGIARIVGLQGQSRSGQNILDLMRGLYRVEIETRRTHPSDAALLAARRGRSTRLVDAIYTEIAAEIGAHLPASSAAKAPGYFLNRQSNLRRFLADPKIPLDNNISERALRTVAQGGRAPSSSDPATTARISPSC